jgi:hypothetical protein
MAQHEKQSMTTHLLPWLELAVKVGAIFAGVFAIVQYLDSRQDTRVEKTLSYVTAFGDANTSIGRARDQIREVLWSNEKQISVLQHAISTLPPGEAAMLRRRFVQGLIEGPDGRTGLREPLDDVIVFFDTLLICTEHSLCDRRSAEAFLSEYAAEFWRNFEQFISDRRRRTSDYGVGIEAFAKQGADGSE